MNGKTKGYGLSLEQCLGRTLSEQFSEGKKACFFCGFWDAVLEESLKQTAVELMQKFPNAPYLDYIFAGFFLNALDFKEAERLFLRNIEKGNEYGSASAFWMTYVLAAQGETDAAEDYYRQAEKLAVTERTRVPAPLTQVLSEASKRREFLLKIGKA